MNRGMGEAITGDLVRKLEEEIAKKNSNSSSILQDKSFLGGEIKSLKKAIEIIQKYEIEVLRLLYRD